MSTVRLLLLLLGLGSCVLAVSTLMAKPSTQTVNDLSLTQSGNFPLGLSSQWLEDGTQQLTPSQALASNNWTASSSENLNFGFSTSAFWLRHSLINQSDLAQWALWIKYSLLDSVEIWLCPLPFNELIDCHYQQAGDQQPFFENRPFNYPNTIFSLNLEAQQHYLLLMKVSTQGTMQLPVNLIDESSLYAQLAKQDVLRGVYFGILLIMGLYNLFIFFATRSRSYAYYAAFTLSFLFLHMVYEGSAFQYFWPHFPIINNYALPIAYAVNMLLLTLFVPSFLSLKEQNSNVSRLFRGYSALILVSLPMLPLLSYQWLVPFYSGLNILLTSSALLAGIYFWAKGNRSARLFTIAWLAFIIGLILANARSFGLIPTNDFTLFAYQIGSFIEVVLLSLALGDRILQLRREQSHARQALLDSQEQAIGYLRDYEDLYQNSLVGKFQLDKEGYFLKTNSAWREIIGYHDEQHFISENPSFNSLFTDNKQRRRFWRVLKENGQVQSYILTLIQPTTGERVVTSVTIRKGADERYAWFGSGQDVTEHFLKEQALIHLQQEKTQSLRQLVQGISTEMDYPLNKIRSAENYLHIEEHVLNDEANHQLTQGITLIKQGGERLSELSKLMQDSVINEHDYPLENIRIRDWLAHWQQQQLNQHTTLPIRFSVHSYLVEWPTYPNALEFVLNQLVENSCIYNAELYQADNLKITLELREHGEFLELHYQDNGQRMTAEQRATLFMPFFTAKNNTQDKGLKLYQAYNLLTELMQGVVEWPDETESFHLIVRFAMPLPAESNPALKD